MSLNFFSRLISWLSCFQRRFNPASTVLSSQRGWRLSLYILLISSVVSLCFSFSPLFSSLVLALTETPTFAALFPTSTLEPTKDVDCPPDASQPIGWGTVTPDEYWVNQCLRCVTPVGTFSSLFVTSTPYPMGTASFVAPGTPTIMGTSVGTGTPVATGTPVVYNPLSCGSSTNGLAVCTKTSDNSLTWTLTGWEGYGGTEYFDVFTTAGGTVYFDFHTWGYWGGESNNSVRSQYFAVGGSAEEEQFTFPYSMNFIQNQYGQWYSDYDEIGQGSLTCGGVEGKCSFRQVMGNYGGWTYYAPDNMVIHVSSSPSGIISTVTPTPIVSLTPSALSYCSSVVSTSSLDTSGVFSLPVPGLGKKTCPVNIDGITIPLYGAFGWGDLVTSPIRICLQEITFGHLIYYGLDVNIDYFAYVLAAAAILRLILRS